MLWIFGITIQLFVSVASFKLDVRLTTQILQSKVDIVGIDKFDREVLRFKIRDDGDADGPDDGKHDATWYKVQNKSDMDVTSAGQSALLSPNTQNFEYISDFEGAFNSPLNNQQKGATMYSPTLGDKPGLTNFAINDDGDEGDRPSRPQSQKNADSQKHMVLDPVSDGSQRGNHFD